MIGQSQTNAFYFSTSENKWIPAAMINDDTIMTHIINKSTTNNNSIIENSAVLRWMQVSQLGIYALLRRSNNAVPKNTSSALEQIFADKGNTSATNTTIVAPPPKKEPRLNSHADTLPIVLASCFSGIVLIAAVVTYDKIRCSRRISMAPLASPDSIVISVPLTTSLCFSDSADNNYSTFCRQL
jgi:hypothetical protein